MKIVSLTLFLLPLMCGEIGAIEEPWDRRVSLRRRELRSDRLAKIVLLYDLLLELNDSAVIALNRAVALSKVHGPNADLTALNKIKNRESLKDYYLFHAVLGEFQLASNHSRESETSFRHALSLTNIPTEQNFLRKRLRSITS